MNRTLPRQSTLLIALVIVVVDQVSKAVASSVLQDGHTLPLLPHLISLQLVHNTGAAFSLLRGSTALLGLLSLGVGIGLILWIWRQRVLPFWQALASAALLGGTLGNGLDRWRLGYVVDFLALEPIDFPIFNGADVAINLAVLCFGIDLWTRRGDTSRG
ncbi:signal peptidase II [Synechococcus sp. HB1133]|uniref:signal peptidase II n=1 Tax=unclassified Synechococcus TaxID=2626047 RepID=UPI00140BA26D|nr:MULTISPECIES: signal peptidase II [unclassified Synechococcus]MCB4394631.1 signal peptidase II [Synechococcus sp. PH41509]MCB4398794.1 signal peptidase II [Synechococcus sp. MU1625]MCB4423545.1 signal peptidase II [Synechococcus sp. HB1133]MCB4431833.1 signal peptidase II [Synechococcus sp. HBA1120]NHI82492.1 signal peptidase II [Synechococcus sp. HB1133]